MPHTRLPFAALVALLTPASPALAAPPGDAEFDRAVIPFFAAYCDKCHDAKVQKGEFRLDTLSRDFAAGPSTMKWMEVIERMRDAPEERQAAEGR